MEAKNRPWDPCIRGRSFVPAVFFAKVDQETIKVMIRKKPSGSEGLWGADSTSKVYPLKRKPG
jgi:hypothetical protein